MVLTHALDWQKSITGPRAFASRFRSAIALLLSGLLTASSVCGQTDSPKDASAADSERASHFASPHAEVSLALALSMKYLADEYFLAGNRDGAAQMYAQAATVLKEEFSSQRVRPSSVDLLRRDIDYRMDLLAKNADFWGFLFSLTPTIPPKQLDNLARHEKELARINTELQAIVASIQSNQKDTFTFDLDAQRAQLDQNVAELESRKAVLNEDFQRHRLDKVQQRLQDLVEMNKKLQAQQDSALQQIQQEQQHLNSLVLQGVSKAAGIPVDLTGLAQGKSMKDAVLNAGTSLLTNPGFLQSLQNVSSATQQAVEVYQKASDVLAKAKSTVAAAQTLEDVIRKPTFEAAAALGQQIYGNLDTNAKQQWESLVETSKPLIPLVELARNNKQIEDAIRQYLSQFPEIKNVPALSYHELEQQVGNLLQNAGPAANQKANEIFDQILTNATGERAVIFNQLTDLTIGIQYAEEKGVSSLKIDQPGRFVDQITTVLQANLDSGVSQGTQQISETLAQGRKVYDQMAPESQNQWQALVATRRPMPLLIELARNTPALEQAIRSYVSQSSQSVDATKLSFDELANRLKTMLADGADTHKASPQIIYDQILSKVADVDRSKVMTDLTALAVGRLNSTRNQESVSVQNVPPTPAAASGPPASVPVQSADPGPAALQAAFAGAIGAAFPEAAVAQVAIQFVAGSMNVIGLADRINSLSDQIARNTVEAAHLRDQEDEAQLQAALSELDKQISDSRYSAAQTELKSLRTAMEQAATSGEEQRAKVAYRLSTAFYLAETLRQDFDDLDRSLGIWTGALEHSRGNLTDALLRDPQNLRLAVDQDIHLFDWIGGDRDLERQRNNIDLLANHWGQLLTLSTDLCQRLGCTKDSPRMGAVSQSADILLRDEVSNEDWNRFLQWQNNRGMVAGKLQPYTLSLLLLPEGMPNRAPLVSPHYGLRTVTVRLGEMAPSSTGDLRVSQTDAIHLIHPGFSYIPVTDRSTKTFRYVKETYRPFDSISLQPPDPSKDKNDDLMKRWAVPGGYSPLPFEGYGLYTVWFIQIDAVERNFRLRDVLLKFIYQYNDAVRESDMVDGPSYTETLISANGLPNLIDTRYFRTLGDSAQVKEKLKSWAAQNGQDPSTVWPFGTPISGDPAYVKKMASPSTALDEWLR